MNCARQYYGGSKYKGFTSADRVTCYQDGVVTDCGEVFAGVNNGSLNVLPPPDIPSVPTTAAGWAAEAYNMYEWWKKRNHQ